MDEFLEHYGTPRHSGRYPWGSGKDPYQKSIALKKYYDELKEQGLSEKDIAAGMGFKSIKQMRNYVTISNAEIKKQQYLDAVKLKEKGYSNRAIGEALKPPMGESSVRNLLDPAKKAKAEVVENVSNILKDGLEKGKFIDIGEGTGPHIGVSDTKLEAAVELLKTQGYQVYNYDQLQQATGKYTKMKVLCPPGTTFSDMYQNRDKVGLPDDWTPDEGFTINKLKPPIQMARDRILVRYAEEGGKDLDGSIEIRPGVADLSLGDTSYAQVRIAVEGDLYMKGMAGYSPNIPDGYDVVYNTNKSKGAPDEKVFKGLKDDPDNPFGASIMQYTYHDEKGEEHQSIINKVGSGEKANEEGKWDTWQRKLPAQFLAKQPIPFAKKQLKLLYDSKEEEFEELKELTNPVVKRQMLMDLADSCDSLSVSMEAAALPRQATKVLRPVPELKDNEVYAPTFKQGEEVALVRFPHAGTFEIPVLSVNNTNKAGKVRVGASARDAIGINPNVAERLSGADFDGDTVLVLPMSSQKIKSTKPLDQLKGFEPKIEFAMPEGVSNGMKDATKQTQMGIVSNLITDMTIRGAPPEKMARAVKHSMVVIDAQKHNLDWKESERRFGIKELVKEYQIKPDGSIGGASTLLSAGTGKVNVPTYREKGFDPTTGKKIIEDRPDDVYISKKTGKLTRRTVERPRLAIRDDAYTLSSGTEIERVYADHSNSLKRLAEQIRIEAGATKNNPISPSAKKTYAPEVQSLDAKLKEVVMNKPKERAAQAIAGKIVADKIKADPAIKDDKDKLKKIRNQEQARARARTGAKRSEIYITDREWEAIQAGAISSTALSKILTRADKTRVRQLATPKEGKILTEATASRIKAMINNGCTLEQAATQMGVSIATVNRALDM